MRPAGHVTPTNKFTSSESFRFRFRPAGAAVELRRLFACRQYHTVNRQLSHKQSYLYKQNCNKSHSNTSAE